MQTPKLSPLNILVYSLLVVGLLLVSPHSIGQELTGKELLQKSIAYHDPDGIWPNFQGKLAITMTTPDGKKRNTQVFMDFTKAYYKSIVKQDVHTITHEFTAGECILKLNNSTVISDAFRESLNINCERARKMKDYYTYLYGLPMKLNDAGTIVDNTVETVNFKEKTYLRLKVTYEEAVGGDTWYFYFDPATYAMEVYQFFHEEDKNDGEYILLSELQEVNGIKMPKVRAWYYNKDDGYLGTDDLRKAGSFQY